LFNFHEIGNYNKEIGENLEKLSTKWGEITGPTKRFSEYRDSDSRK